MSIYSEIERQQAVNRREILGWLKGFCAGTMLSAVPLSSSGLPVTLSRANQENKLVSPNSPTKPSPTLDFNQSNLFRAWFTKIVHAQLESGPNPRWVHRDCAGLIRFAVDETLREHDEKWKKYNGFLNQKLPADLILQDAQKQLRQNWRLADGSQSAYVNALELIQENTRFIGHSVTLASPGDLLFFDLADQQHLMIWMGRYLAYHTGQHLAHDNGLRAVSLERLSKWQDTRWRPVSSNPNFRGLFRLGFLV